MLSNFSFQAVPADVNKDMIFKTLLWSCLSRYLPSLLQLVKNLRLITQCTKVSKQGGIWFPREITLSSLKVTTVKPSVSDYPKCEDLVVAYKKSAIGRPFLEEDQIHIHFKENLQRTIPNLRYVQFHVVSKSSSPSLSSGNLQFCLWEVVAQGGLTI